jgi:hypothetical protein
LEDCRVIQYTAQVTGEKAEALCTARAQGTLGDTLDSGTRLAMRSDAGFQSNVSDVLLLHYSVSGCDDTYALGSVLTESSHRRALRQATLQQASYNPTVRRKSI